MLYNTILKEQETNSMRYELTKDLLTGNAMIDSEHKQLFDAINALLDACAQGKGRDSLPKTGQFLNSYVTKHFSDEEQLQVSSKYPGYPAHKTFHDGYKRKLQDATDSLLRDGATVRALGEINQLAGILISHIRTEDRKLAQHLHSN